MNTLTDEHLFRMYQEISEYLVFNESIGNYSWKPPEYHNVFNPYIHLAKDGNKVGSDRKISFEEFCHVFGIK